MSKIKQHIIQKLDTNQAINDEEAFELYDLDIFTLGKFAKKIKTDQYGNEIYFNINRHLNPTNVCKDTCKFCGYAANRKQQKSWTMTNEEILSEVDDEVSKVAREIHIVSAHNPKVPIAYYFDNIIKIKAKYPSIHINALTAAEIDFIAKKFKLSYQEVIEKMIASGLDSMPGGGPESFDETVGHDICRGKVPSAEWPVSHNL